MMGTMILCLDIFWRVRQKMALSVIKLESIKDSLELNFELPEKRQWQVVCPSPVIADAMRRRLSSHPLNVECLTISKFLGDFYNELHPEKEVTRKSQLLRVLATIWRMKFSEEPTYYFEQAFELFTDLRSFTLTPELIENVLSHYDPVVAEAVRYFWLIVEGQEIVDEHLAYHLILEGLEQGEVDVDSALNDVGLVFQGFTHLSGSQIDLLKMLGRYCDVVIPIPTEVVKESIKTDWVDWITTQADNVEERAREEEGALDYAKIIEFEKLSQNQTLSKLLESTSSDVLLVKNSLNFRDILNINQRDFFFKTELDFFKGISKSYFETLEKLVSSGGSVEISKIEELLQVKLKGLMGRPRDFQLFSEIKFIKLLSKEIEEWCSLSSENEIIDLFSLKVVWEILTLNLPRNYSIPLLENSSSRIMSLKELSEINSMDEVVIIADEGHDLRGGNTSSYSREVSEILYTLGPVRRKGLDILFYRAQLKEVLRSSKATLMIEKGLVNHDKLWNNLVSQLLDSSGNEVEELSLEQQLVEKKKEEFSPIEHGPSKSLSASRLQTYLDCPRKYYYSYILKMGNEPARLSSVDPRLLGNFEHEIVQVYLGANRAWNEEAFNEIVEKTIKLPIGQMESSTLYEETLAEVKFYSRVMIEELLKLVQKDPDCVFQFESPMKGEGALGYADVYITSEVFGKMLFDLKRSSGSVPLKNEVMSLGSIQLWYYMQFLEKERAYFDVYGYLNFSDPESSLLFMNNNDSAECLTQLGFLNVKKMIPTEEFYKERQEEFLELYEKTKTDIIEKKSFPICPKNSSACHFCPGNVICSREVDNVKA
jgi:CRISPR/Cas system-associated exonuclease Cas4 (RecB family)